MKVLAIAAVVLQSTLMLVDEIRFHRRRGLPRWERIGHPIDTLSVLACYLLALFWEPTRDALTAYVILAAFSCLLITKDEFVHAQRCEPAEHWLHALLFVLHPVVLFAAALLWLAEERSWLLALAILTAAFAVYQALYWNVIAPQRQSSPGTVDPSSRDVAE